MKAPRRNHQEAKFDREKPPIPKEKPIFEKIRKAIFFSIIFGICYFLYSCVWVRFQVERTVKEIYSLEQSVRQLTPSHLSYQDTANLNFLFLSGHIGSDVYNENTKLMRNRFGGAIVIEPVDGGMAFGIEIAGIPSYVCKRVVTEDWSSAGTLQAIRVGVRTYSMDKDAELKLPIPEEDVAALCSSRNIKIIFK